MKDDAKTKKQLIGELRELRRQISVSDSPEKASEQNRESREALMISHLHNLIPGCFTTLKEGRFVEVSEAFLRLFEFSRDEVIGHTWTERKSISKEQISVFLEELKKKHRVENFAMQATTKTGKLIHVLVNTVMRTIDKEKYLMTIMTDITALKTTEEALRESEHFQNSIFLAAPVGIGLVVNRVIKRVNRRLCEMTGYSPEELFDKSARMLYPTDQEFEFVGTEKYNQINRNGVGSVETRWVRKDGRIIDVMLSSTPLEPGKLEEGVTFTALDITDRKRAEDDLMRAHDELEKRIEERTAELAQVVRNLTEHEQLLAAESRRLQDANTALKVLLQQREEDRKELERKFIDNVRRLVLPYVEKLTVTSLTPHQAGYVDVIETSLANITSPFLRNLSIMHMDFTPREIEVAHLIKAGKTAKEIASLLNCSLRSVEFHKNNIRRKLKLIHKKTNLRTYLLSMTDATS